MRTGRRFVHIFYFPLGSYLVFTTHIFPFNHFAAAIFFNVLIHFIVAMLQ